MSVDIYSPQNELSAPIPQFSSNSNFQPADAGGDSQQAGNNAPDKKEEKKLPRILWSNQSLSMVEPEVLDAIRNGNSPPTIFQFAGKLVRLHWGLCEVSLESLTIDSMRYHVDRWMTFTMNNNLGKGKTVPVPIPAPIDVVRDLLAMPSWSENVFPTIERICQCPYFTNEGQLVWL